MKTAEEYVEKMVKIYEAKPGDYELQEMVDILKRIKPGSLDALFVQMEKDFRPTQTFRCPGIKDLYDSIKNSNTEILNRKASMCKCPVCGTDNYTSGSCPNCHFDPANDNFKDHLKWWEDYKVGKVPVYDFSDIFRKIGSKKINN